MPDSALYLTTAATLQSSHINQKLSWLMATLSIFAQIWHAPVHPFILCLLMVVWLLSAYGHLRICIDIHLLTSLAKQDLHAEDISNTLLVLRMRQKPLSHTPLSRCLACLRWWRWVLCIDSVLLLLSSIVLLLTF